MGFLSGHDQDYADVRTHLLKLKRDNVDAIVLNTNSEAGFLSALKRVREVLGSLPVYGMYFPGNRAFLDQAGGLADDIIYVEAPSPDSCFTDEGRTLARSFEEMYGPLQSSPFVLGSTFEAFHLFVQGNANNYKGNRDLRSFLYNGRFRGIFGSYRFNRAGDIEGVTHSLKKIVNGRSVALG